MNKSIIIKSLLNVVGSYIVIVLIHTLFKGVPFGQALATPYTIVLGICAGVGSFIGYMSRGNKK